MVAEKRGICCYFFTGSVAKRYQYRNIANATAINNILIRVRIDMLNVSLLQKLNSVILAHDVLWQALPHLVMIQISTLYHIVARTILTRTFVMSFQNHQMAPTRNR